MKGFDSMLEVAIYLTVFMLTAILVYLISQGIGIQLSLKKLLINVKGSQESTTVSEISNSKDQSEERTDAKISLSPVEDISLENVFNRNTKITLTRPPETSNKKRYQEEELEIDNEVKV
jgi:hypothetical protein